MAPRPLSTAERRVVVAILIAIALLLRVGYVAMTHVKDPLRTDAGQYVQYAHNLVDHGTFSLEKGEAPEPDSFRSPGYPLFLAATMLVAGGDGGWYSLARWLQVLLGAAMVPLTYLLARLFLGYWPAVVATGMVAASPHLVTSTGYILTETLSGFMLLLGLWLLTLAARRDRLRLSVGAGAALGVACLVNEALVLLPVALAGAMALRAEDRATTLRRCAPALAVCLCLVGGWAMRNQIQVSTAERSGSRRALRTISHGTYPDWVHEDPRYRYSAYLEDPEQPAFGESWSRLREVLGQRVAADPGRYLRWYLVGKPWSLWSWNILQGQGDVYVFPVAESLYQNVAAANITRLAMKALHPVVLLLLFAGLASLLVPRVRRRAPPEVLTLAAVLAYVTAVYAVTAPWPRYSVPLRPELYVFATWAAVRAGSWLSSRRAGSTGAGLGG